MAGGGVEGATKLVSLSEEIRSERPMIPDNSVDCVVSNCVLNLVRGEDRQKLFDEIYRVLKPGGMAAISDIVSDESVPQELQNDENLWSGCISGAWREDEFVEEFMGVGFQGVKIDKRQEEAWQTVEGIEFRSVTLLAHKPIGEVCLERNQAVIYRGPFEKVLDDDDHVYFRGKRMAVCDKTYQILKKSAYADQFYFIDPVKEIPLSEAKEFNCAEDQIRDARQSKGKDFKLTVLADGDCCGESTDCC